MNFRVGESPSNQWAKANLVAVNPADFPSHAKHILINEGYVFSIRPDDSIQPGTLGLAAHQRKWGYFSLGQGVNAHPFNPAAALGATAYLGSISLTISFFRKNMEDSKQFDTDDMAKVFLTTFVDQVFTKDQTIYMDFHGTTLVAVVLGVEVVDLDALKIDRVSNPDNLAKSEARSAARGILIASTQINFTKAHDSSIKLMGSSRGGGNQTALIKPNFNFQDLGIGGLDDQFGAIFRRAFSSRVFPPSLVATLGIQHVKGILLYGPPGTGKTLIARQIGKMLNAKEPIVVNGPEILNKFVGQSEENIRALFAEAEKEYKAKGDESGLHMIIFDEIDAICKQRGSKGDSTGVGDSVVNQLLSKLDGVNQLNNILVIGMTNRLDMIDEALLRPGRLEVHMEIPLPDEGGRVQIFGIHTASMKKNGRLDRDVDVPELATLTKNFSGAEICGVVKAAASFALNHHIKMEDLKDVSAETQKNIKVTRSDFLNALEEIHPSFGVSESELEHCIQRKIIPFGEHIDGLLSKCARLVKLVETRDSLVSVLLHGASGSGKTALAATIALASEFPFVKLISPETFVGMSETAKVAAIGRVFDQAYKSVQSVIVIDDLELLIDYVEVGPRFSNVVLQALLVLLKRRPPKGRRLFVIATTGLRSVLGPLRLLNVFNEQLYVPNIRTLDAVSNVVKGLNFLDDQQHLRAMRQLMSIQDLNSRLDISIKSLLFVCDAAQTETDETGAVDRTDEFVKMLMAYAE